MANLVENLPADNSRDSAIDSPFHRTAWRVFVANDLVRERADRGLLGGRQFVVTGHPKADALRQATPAWPIKRPGGERARLRIVWSAHHTILSGWTDFGMFHKVYRDMLQWAQEDLDLDFVFMAHPALPPVFHDADSPMTAVEFQDFVEQWVALPNAMYATGVDYAPICAASDFLIVDGISLLMEYQIWNKPVMFLERPGHARFNPLGDEVVRGVHPAQSVAEVRQTIESIKRRGSDPLSTVQREIVARLFGNEPAVPRVLAALRAAVAEDRPWTPGSRASGEATSS